MLSTNCSDYLAVFLSLQFQLTMNIFDWQLPLVNKTTKANFTCPPDHHTFIFTWPREKITWHALGNQTWDFFLLCKKFKIFM